MGVKVSIIVPIYNVADYLAGCVESLINQTYKNIEIILVNDGSPDDSKFIIDKYAQKDNRIVAIHKDNKGAAHTRATGVEAATGDYLTFCDGDDQLKLTAIQQLVGWTNNGTIELTSGSFTYVCNGDEKSSYVFKETGLFDDGKVYINKILRGQSFFALHGRLFKRTLFSNIQTKDIKVGQDAILCFQLFYNAKTISVNNIPVYNYNQRLTSTSYNKSKQYILETLRFADLVKKLFYNQDNYLDQSIDILVLNHFIIGLHKGGHKYLKGQFNEMNSYYKKYKKELVPSQRIRYRAYKLNSKIGEAVDQIFHLVSNKKC